MKQHNFKISRKVKIVEINDKYQQNKHDDNDNKSENT